MEGLLTLSRKELNRLDMLTKVKVDVLTVNQVAKLLRLTPRHVWRLLAAYRKEGAAALAHGNRGRRPANALEAHLKVKVVELALSTYAGFNTTHFTEFLAEREGIFVSRSSVRNILLGGGIRSPRKRRPPKHRSRRERFVQKGMLLQIDGSHHDWLEGRGPWLSLIGAVDDATGTVPHALFREQEDSSGYMSLLRGIVCNHGIPLALYHDRHSIFEVSPNKLPSIDEQLEGKMPLTQFGRLLDELGITSIRALSPQAKGRIERLWGTFQDRLVSELRLAGAKTIDEATRVLRDFLPRYNQKFAVPAKESGSAYRPVEEGFVPDEVFCFKERRTVGADNVVSFEGHRLQVVPTNGRASYAKCRVEVHQRLDGSLAVYYQGKRLTTRLAPPEPAILRKWSKVAELIPVNRGAPVLASHKPAPGHPWRSWVYRANKE